MMKILWFSTIIYIVQIFTTCQTSVVMTITDTSFYADPEYFSDQSTFKLVNKDIKNELFSKLDIIKTLPTSAWAHIEILVETDGEYKILDNFDQWMPMCELIDEPVLLGKVFKTMGFKGCPVEPGVYSSPSYVATPIGDKVYPSGNYMSRLSVIAEDKVKVLGSAETKFRIE